MELKPPADLDYSRVRGSKEKLDLLYGSNSVIGDVEWRMDGVMDECR